MALERKHYDIAVTLGIPVPPRERPGPKFRVFTEAELEKLSEFFAVHGNKRIRLIEKESGVSRHFLEDLRADPDFMKMVDRKRAQMWALLRSVRVHS